MGNPAVGQIGTVVTITGLSLRGSGPNVSSVTLGGVSASIVSETDSSVVVITPRGTGVGETVQLTSTSGATVTKTSAWDYLDEGDITILNPSSGQDGTNVVISGTNLLGGGQSVSSITLGGIEVTSIGDENDTSISIVAAH